MIITVKNLQQQTFKVEFEAEKTVLQLKEKIYIERGPEYSVEKQKLIYAGTILDDDDRSIASYNVDEKKFVVVLLKRELGAGGQRPDGSLDGASTSRSVTSIGSETSLGEEKRVEDAESTGSGSGSESGSGSSGDDCGGAALASVTSRTSLQSTTSDSSLLSAGSVSSEASHSTYSSGDLAGVFSDTSFHAPAPSADSHASPLLEAGDEYSRSVESMVQMGYSRELVVRAMTASFNNPERAVDFLIAGIPESPEDPNDPGATVDDDADEGVDGVGDAVDDDGHNVSAANVRRVEGVEDAGDGSFVVPFGPGPMLEVPAGADPFEFLRTQRQFSQMRSLVYQNPDLLYAVLQQIGQTNPALLELISENQDAFLSMLNEPIEGPQARTMERQTPSQQPQARSQQHQQQQQHYPHRRTPGRRAQLAAAARAAAGGDGLHVRPLDTAPGAGGDGPPTAPRRPPPPGESGDAGSDPMPHDRRTAPPVLRRRRPERAAELLAAAADTFMRERAAAAAAVAALTAAATVALDRPGVGDGDGDGAGHGVVFGPENLAGRVFGDGSGDGAGGEGLGVRPATPPRSLPPTAHGAGADGDGTPTIRLTPADEEAIERLQALGFPEFLVLQAYFACDKDEELAANFLISSLYDD